MFFFGCLITLYYIARLYVCLLDNELGWISYIHTLFTLHFLNIASNVPPVNTYCACNITVPKTHSGFVCLFFAIKSHPAVIHSGSRDTELR